jgi:hypothetical protein
MTAEIVADMPGERSIESFRVFAEFVLVRLREAAAGTAIDMRLHHRVVFEGESFYDDGEFRPRFWPLADAIWNAGLWNDEEIGSSLRVLLDCGVLFLPDVADEGGQRVENPSFDQMKPGLFQDLLPHVIGIAEKAKSLEPSDDMLRDAAVAFIRSRTRAQAWSFSVPLINLTSDVASITFGRLTLGPMSDEEKSRIWGSGSMQVEMIRLLDLLRATLKLSYEGVREKASKYGFVAVGPLEAELRTEAGNAVTALRLLKRGQIGAPIYAHLEEHGIAGMGNQTLYRTSDHLEPAKFELLASEVEEVQGMFSELQTATGNGTLASLDIAIRRFHQSYSRGGGDDQVIDLAIAFEAMVLQGVKEELGYRLAVRAAALLRDTRDPAETFMLMGQFYRVRSKVVHEGVPLHLALRQQRVKRLGSANRMPPDEFVALVADLLRACLRAYLRAAASGQSVGAVNDLLDQQVISSLLPPGPQP